MKILKKNYEKKKLTRIELKNKLACDWSIETMYTDWSILVPI